MPLGSMEVGIEKGRERQAESVFFLRKKMGKLGNKNKETNDCRSIDL